MRVLICGSRNWRATGPIMAVIAGCKAMADENGEPLVIIHGDADGADRIAKRIGKQCGAEVISEPADWNQHGKAAGPIRNQKMLDDHKPHVIWAFRSTGKSNGTDDMTTRGRARGTPTFVVNGD